MNKYKQIPSVLLGLLAFFLWLLSLTGTAFVTDHGTNPEASLGYMVLGMGWLSLLAANIAWYANLTFLLGSISIIFTNKSAIALSISSFILSLDTFRFTSIPGGGRADIYAYGLGSVFWFASFAILIIAAGVREVELKKDIYLFNIIKSPLVIIGLFLLLVITTLSIKWSVEDRQGASATEQKYLSEALFKRGKVCKKHVSTPIETLELDGPLEIIGKGYPLDSPQMLIKWGVPTVRKDGYDYFLQDKTDMNSIVTQPSQGEASVQLHLTTTKNRREKYHINSINAVLKSYGENRIGFDQTWSRGGSTGREYCPEYNSSAKDQSEQPRKLLLSALKLPSDIIIPSKDKKGIFNNLGWPPLETNFTVNKVEGTYIGMNNNKNCPKNIGFLKNDDKQINIESYSHHIFQLNEQYYFPSHNHDLTAICVGDSVYLYSIWGKKKDQQFLLSVSKRSLIDFKDIWTTRINVDYYPNSGYARKFLTINDIQQDSKEVLLKMINTEKQELLTINFTLP